MKIKNFVFLGITALFFLLPALVLATEKRVIFSSDFLASPVYQNSGRFWQIANNSDQELYRQQDGLTLKSDGNAYLVYPFEFNYYDFDRLNIKLYADQPLIITVIPNIVTHLYNSFELRKKIAGDDTYHDVTFSLRQRFFKEKVKNIGLNLYSKNPANIVIKEISLAKMTLPQLFIQAIKDYWRAAPYEPYTVNFFPTPLILGWAAMAYFFPVVLLLVWLFLFQPKWQKTAGIILLIIWVFIDLRMSYEFFTYHLADYQTFIKPPIGEKTLRNYEDFYSFADWVGENLTSQGQTVNFYNFGSADFPRLLQYLIYPVRVNGEKGEAKIYVNYNRQDLIYNEAEKRLYQKDQPISGVGEIVAVYNQNSFIFKEK